MFIEYASLHPDDMADDPFYDLADDPSDNHIQVLIDSALNPPQFSLPTPESDESELVCVGDRALSAFRTVFSKQPEVEVPLSVWLSAIRDGL